MTCSACLSVACRLFSSKPALCLCLITVKHIRRLFLCLVHINIRVYVQATTKVFISAVCHIVYFNAPLIGSLFVLICMTSTCYPLFMFSPHTTCLFLLSGFFLMLLFPPQLPFCVCSELCFDVTAPAQPCTAVWTR